MARHQAISKTAHFLIPAENVVDDPAERIILLFGQRVPAILVTALRVEFREFLDRMVVDGIRTDGRRILEPLDGGDVEGGCPGKLVFVIVVVLLLNTHHGIVTGQTVRGHRPVVTAQGVRTDLAAILVEASLAVGRIPRLLFARGAKHLQRAVRLLAHVVAGIGTADIEVEFEPAGDLVAQTGADRKFVEIGLVEVSLLVLVAAGDIEGGLIIAAGHRDRSGTAEGPAA